MTTHPEQPSSDYEPPKVEEVSTEAGPAVTAAGDSPVTDEPSS